MAKTRTHPKPAAVLKPGPATSRPTRAVLAALGLYVLTILSYLPIFSAGFIWDDDYYVTHNLALTSVDGLGRIWTHLGEVPQYYPLTHTTFWVEHQLWGNAPAGYHIINVLLHATSALLLWRLMLRLKVPGAWVIATIFAVHPVHVESVGWVTERKNVLSGLFYLLSLGVYLRLEGDGDPSRRPQFHLGRYLASLALFVAALLSKTVASTLPAAVLLIVWWKQGTLRWRNILPLIPFFALGACFGSLTSSMERSVVGAYGPDWDLSLAQRLIIAGRSLWFYIGKLFYPAELTFIYPRWSIDASSARLWLFPAGMLLVIVTLLLLRKRIGRGPLVAILFFCGTLTPALGFFNTFPMLYSFVADHFQYLASIGVIAFVVGTFATLVHPPRLVRVVLPALVICCLVVLTFFRAQAYHDLRTLWIDTLAKNPHAWMAANNLAHLDLEDAESADPDHKTELAHRAQGLLEQSLHDKPDNLTARTNLGQAYSLLGDPAHALQLWEEVINSPKVGNPRAWPIAAGDAAFMCGRQYAQVGDQVKAAEYYQRALEIRPQHVQAMTQFAALLASSGDFAHALPILQSAAQLSPDAYSVWTNLGNLHFQAGEPVQAEDAYRHALMIKPDHIPARYGLAISLALTGQLSESEQILRDLQRTHPNSADILASLGTVLAKQQRVGEAKAMLEHALQLQPNHAAARRQLEKLP